MDIIPGSLKMKRMEESRWEAECLTREEPRPEETIRLDVLENGRKKSLRFTVTSHQAFLPHALTKRMSYEVFLKSMPD